MKIQAWQVSSLPLVECYLSDDLTPWAGFSHVSTRVRGTVSATDQRPMGDTVWAGVQGGREVALAWDWLELLPGVVCLLDPNSITTNARFIDQQDCYEEPLQAIISANRLVHMWPWQRAVINHMVGGSGELRQPRSARRQAALGHRAAVNTASSAELRRAA